MRLNLIATVTVLYVYMLCCAGGDLILILLSGRGHVLCFTGRLRGDRRAPLINKKYILFFTLSGFGLIINKYFFGLGIRVKNSG